MVILPELELLNCPFEVRGTKYEERGWKDERKIRREQN
jgi:hypothetical protein